MVVNAPVSNESGLVSHGLRLRIDDLDNTAPSSSDYLEANIALIWPYSSSTQRLSFLLTEETPLARKTKRQLKVTFQGICAREVAHIRVGIGDRVNLSLNEVNVTDSYDSLSTPGKKSRFELHFSHSVQLEVYSASKDVRRVNFVAPIHSPASPSRNSLNGDVDFQKSTTIPISGGPLPFKTDSRLSSSSFAESFVDPFTKELDRSDGHRSKRTRFARNSGAWRLADDNKEATHGYLLPPHARLDNSVQSRQNMTVSEVRIQPSGSEHIHVEERDHTIFDRNPASSQSDLDSALSMLPDELSQPLTTAAEVEIAAASPGQPIDALPADQLANLQSPPATRMSTPRLEAVPSSALSFISPLVQRAQHSPMVSAYTSELEASADLVAASNGMKSPTPFTDLADLSAPITKPGDLPTAVDVVDHVSDELNNVSTHISPDFVDLDLLEQQVDLEHTIRHEAGTETNTVEDQDMYSPHLPIRPYIEHEQPITANSPVSSKTESDHVTHLAKTSGDLLSVSNQIEYPDKEQAEDVGNPQITLASPSLLQGSHVNDSDHNEGNDRLKAATPPTDLADDLASAIKEVVEFEEAMASSLSPLAREGSTALGKGLQISAGSNNIELTDLKSGEAAHAVDAAEDPVHRVNDSIYQAMTPSTTQPALRQLHSPKQPNTITAMPPTPSYSQKQVQNQVGFDGVADSDAEHEKLADPIKFLSSTLPDHLDTRPPSQTISELQFVEGLASDYFTPFKRAPEFVETSSAQEILETSSDDPLNGEVSAENNSDQAIQDLHQFQTLAGSTSTPTSYYPSLDSLLEHYGQLVDILAICTTNSMTPQRAQTGPKHFFTTLQIVDASVQAHNDASVTVQLFRYRQDALPIPKRGDVILLRNLKVQIKSRHPLLVSSDESAWAVFGFDDLLNLYVVTAGPPVEFDASEEDKARLLRRWWLKVGQTGHSVQPTMSKKESQEGTAVARLVSKKQPNLHIDLRRSPRQTRATNNFQSHFDVASAQEGFSSSSPPQEPRSPSSRMQLGQNPMQPPDTPSWSAISPTSNEVLKSVPPTPSSDRVKLQPSPRSPQSDLINADSGSIITTASIATTDTSRRRSMRRSVSLVHELRDGTQYVDVQEEEAEDVSPSDGESAAAGGEVDQTGVLEARHGLGRPKGKQKQKQKQKIKIQAGDEKDVGSSTTVAIPSKARPTRHRGSHTQIAASHMTNATATPDAGSSDANVENNPRLTRSQTKAIRDT